VALGGMFSSETMFHRAPDAGSAALVAAAGLLAAAGFVLWDIQATPSTPVASARRTSHGGVPAPAGAGACGAAPPLGR